MNDATKGFWAMVTACVIWGLSSIYYKALSHVPPLEVLSHRTIWSLVFFGLILTFQGRLRVLGAALRSRDGFVLVFSATVISINWFTFIWSVQSGRAMEASLGYYVFPLVAVLIGVLAFGERLGRLQAIAVGLAGVAVAVLFLGLGAKVGIVLILAVSFGLYGLAKKYLSVGPVVSVTAEVLLLAPLALLWLTGLHAGWWQTGGQDAHFGRDAATTAMLAFSGVLTAGPLMLFSYAARRVRLATVGLVQYLNPTLQFACATLVFGEPLTLWHTVAFAVIWTALALYSYATLRQPKAVANPVSSVLTSGTTLR
jgi:chloramphenicol-sensitive protein RarD